MEVAVVAANTESAIGTVQTIVPSFSVQAEATATKVVGEMEERVKHVAAYSDA